MCIIIIFTHHYICRCIFYNRMYVVMCIVPAHRCITLRYNAYHVNEGVVRLVAPQISHPYHIISKRNS